MQTAQTAEVRTESRAWVTLDEAAERARCSRRTINRLLAAGQLTRYRILGRPLIDAAELDMMIRRSAAARE